MTEITTLNRVRSLFEEAAGPSALKQFGDDQVPWKAGGDFKPGDLDSLDKVEFLMAIEDEFHVEIPGAIAVHLDTLEKIAAHVDVLLSTKNASAH